MGKFSELVSAQANPKPETLPEIWKDHFPLLCEAMFPPPGKATGTYLSPRYSVTVFTEGCRLKAVVGAREAPKKFWATLDGPEAILEQIEALLVSGGGEWRDSKEEK